MSIDSLIEITFDDIISDDITFDDVKHFVHTKHNYIEPFDDLILSWDYFDRSASPLDTFYIVCPLTFHPRPIVFQINMNTPMFKNHPFNQPHTSRTILKQFQRVPQILVKETIKSIKSLSSLDDNDNNTSNLSNINNRSKPVLKKHPYGLNETKTHESAMNFFHQFPFWWVCREDLNINLMLFIYHYSNDKNYFHDLKNNEIQEHWFNCLDEAFQNTTMQAIRDIATEFQSPFIEKLFFCSYIELFSGIKKEILVNDSCGGAQIREFKSFIDTIMRINKYFDALNQCLIHFEAQKWHLYKLEQVKIAIVPSELNDQIAYIYLIIIIALLSKISVASAQPEHVHKLLDFVCSKCQFPKTRQDKWDKVISFLAKIMWKHNVQNFATISNLRLM